MAKAFSPSLVVGVDARIGIVIVPPNPAARVHFNSCVPVFARVIEEISSTTANDDWYCNGDLWGYGDDMQTVRENAQRLGLISHEE